MAGKELRTRRLRLRQYAVGNEELFISLNCEPEARRYMDGPLTLSEAKERFERFIANDDERIEAWAVTVAATEKYIGHAYLVATDPGGEAEVGFILRREDWGHGYGTEVASAVVDYGLRSGRFVRVLATVDADHAASIKVLERAGMRLEREVQTERQHYLVFFKSQG